MTSTQNNPQSLRDAWNTYVSELQSNQSQQRAYAKVAQTKTALIRYTLPDWGLTHPQGNKLTAWEVNHGLEFMSKISLHQIQTVLVAQQHVFEAQQVPEHVRRTYRSALNQFVNWCQEQDWFEEVMTGGSPQRPAKVRKRSAQDLRYRRTSAGSSPTVLPYRYAIGAVEGDVIYGKLRQDLDEFTAFRLDPDLLGFKPVQQKTVNRDVTSICQILGWLHRIQGVKSEELQLTQLVPYVPIHKRKEAKVAAERALAIAFNYIDWLQRSPAEGGRGRSVKEHMTPILKTFLTVARFLYRHEIAAQTALAVKPEQTIPVIEALETESRLSRDQRNFKEYKTYTAKQLTDLDWNQVLALVEQLRFECAPRALLQQQTRKQPTRLGPLRSLSAIAQSYQRFLLFAFMAYLPPARLQTYRNLLIQPKQGLDEIEPCSYCGKEEGVWYLSFRQEAIAAHVTEREHRLQIPNISYSEGHSFYNYLEGWLKEYTYLNEEGEEVSIEGLRQVFQPQHSHFFSKKNGLRYEDATEMSNLIRNAAYRITGKVLTSSTIGYLFVVQASLISRKRSIRALSEFTLSDIQTYLTIFDLSDAGAVKAAAKIAAELAQKFTDSQS